MAKEVLIVFLKNPIKGKTKTRLAKDIGDAMALKVYDYLVQYTLNVTEGVKNKRAVDVVLYYSNFIPKERLPGYRYALQVEGDLGEKMLNAFQNEFDNGYRKVAIIGSDCLELQVEDLDKLFDKLLSYPIVIGPSLDGGYYALAMSKLQANVFVNKSWSTPVLMEETCSELRVKGVPYCLLKTLNDVDQLSDLGDLSKEFGF